MLVSVDILHLEGAITHPTRAREASVDWYCNLDFSPDTLHDLFLKFWVNSRSLISKIEFHPEDLRPISALSVANDFGSAGCKGKTV